MKKRFTFKSLTTSISSCLIGKNLLKERDFLFANTKPSKNCLLLIEKKLVVPWKSFFLEKLSNFAVHALELPGGEECKTRKMKEWIEDRCLELDIGFLDQVVAVGGGAHLDLCGFFASTWCRGVPLSFVPTTLLAMVDASIGGKNGINLGMYKNYLGDIYQPKQIFIDSIFLESLPVSEIKCGLVEMLKHSLLEAKDSYVKLMAQIPHILAKDERTLIHAIYASCRFKAEVVKKSESRKELRHMLNLGHTIGHALESLENFTLPHGKAVAIGIFFEALLSHKMGYLSNESLSLIEKGIELLGLDIQLSTTYGVAEFKKALKKDKKSENSVPHFVLLEDIGLVLENENLVCHPVPEKLLDVVLEELLVCFRRP